MKYLNKLDEEKLVDFLNSNGLFLCETVGDEWGNSDAEYYYFKCFSPLNKNNKIANKLKQYLSAKLPNSSIDIGSYFENSQIQLYALNDFVINRLYIDGEYTQFDIDLQHRYHDMMRSEFNDNGQYDIDYDSYVDEISQEI